MPKLFNATLLAVVMATCGAQAAEVRALPPGSYEVAQVNDPRVYQLEEQVRQLNGRVEELTFQLLELQEQLRRMQENNEFRFQELEGGQPGSDDKASLEPKPAEEPQQSAAAPIQQPAETPTAPDGRVAGIHTPAAQPRDLGTLTIDGNGNVVDGSVDFSQQKIDSAIDGEAVASVSVPDDPEAYYREGYRQVLNGDYNIAEGVFRSFVELFPNDPLVADARFWLAESVRAQGRLQEAAEDFIGLRRDYPDTQKAPETLLKIGQIMYELGDRDVACVTFADAETNYPRMSDTVRSRIRAERAKAQC
ncbi:tol-pal system protein YbgF [Oricola sp.]|uniref:tol-pal system protein YbgF n=1 Tax=Oricola sp. TaxID=1979950 RepID=UPI0025F63513|nr:tol-pal system protein YbgF [Oricola sp.]MCI5074601.1 tol-pal system protein YbgF [Oricola sp.]